MNIFQRVARAVFGAPEADVGNMVAKLTTEYGGAEHDRFPSLVDGEDAHPSPILQRHSNGLDLGEVYDQMDLDPRVAAEMWRRATASVACRKYIRAAFVQEGDESSPEHQAAELCRTVLGSADAPSPMALKERNQVQVRQVMDSVGRGISIVEVMWKEIPSDDGVSFHVPVALKTRPMKRFTFIKGELHIRQGWSTRFKPQPVPPYKFLILRHGSTDSPWGQGLYDILHKSFFLRKEVLQYWSRDIEKFASPPVGVEYENSDTRGQRDDPKAKATESIGQQALKLGKSIVSAKVFTFTGNFKPTLFERKRGGDAAGFASFLGEMAKEIALVISGQIALSGLRGSVGSYASDETHAKVEKQRASLDAQNLDTVYQELCNWMTWINYGVDVVPPTYNSRTEDLDDLKLQFEALRLAKELSIPTALAFVRRVLGNPEPQDGETLAAAFGNPYGHDLSNSEQSDPSTDIDTDLERAA